MTRSSRGPVSRGADAAWAAGAEAALGAEAAFWASALVMLPLGPVAWMALGSRLFSDTTRCTAGERCGSSDDFNWAEPASADLPSGAEATGAAPEPEPDTLPITWPGLTLAPSGAPISVSTPSAGEATSTATLSVSISTSSSSFLTVSPAFFSHVPIVPSATLSPMVGTAMEMASPPEPDATGASVRSLLVSD